MVGSLAGLVALGPALRPGYLLAYDMVFVPDQPLTATVLGTDGSVPRAVPNDLVVVLASTRPARGRGAEGAAARGLRARRLGSRPADAHPARRRRSRRRRCPGTPTSSSGWRSAIGASCSGSPPCRGRSRPVLPYAGREPGAGPQLCLVVALAGLAGSTALVLVAVLVLALLAGPGWRDRIRVGGWVALTTLGAAAPWLVPALREVGSLPADPAGVAAFAARADTPLGVLPSLRHHRRHLEPRGVAGRARRGAGGGRRPGPGRGGSGRRGRALAAAGREPRDRPRWPREPSVSRSPWPRPSPGWSRWCGWSWSTCPAAAWSATVRSSSRSRCCRSPPARASRPSGRGGTCGGGAWVIVLLPVALLPSLAWGVHGRLQPVDYPATWPALRAEVDRATEARPGAVAVFPFTYYRRYAWNGDRVVLDPVPRLLDADVVANDDLPLQNGVVARRGPAGRADPRGLSTGAATWPACSPARASATSWRSSTSPTPTANGPGCGTCPCVWRAGDLALLRVPGATVPAPHRPPPVGSSSVASPCWPRPAPSCCPGCAAAARLRPTRHPATDGGLAWRSAGTPASLRCRSSSAPSSV